MLILPKKMCDGHVEEREFSHLFHTTICERESPIPLGLG